MNSWSLLYDILNGTFDEVYPIVETTEEDISESEDESKQRVRTLFFNG